ncbi:hypothetical protein V5799_023978 [Amblyomma americanum]|uniref:Uncharacterized protein n=1 Tax=Amblyomma americanum TaxID=6943 RepID=A0AAQ4EDU0_AMBAM
MAEMKESLNFINEEFETFKSQLSAVLAENQELKKENQCLRNRCTENEKRLNALEVKLVQCNLEIKGVTETGQEDLESIVGKMGDAVGVSISPADIEACHRVPTRKAEVKHIIVQFRSRRLRDHVLEKARKQRLTTASLGVPPPTGHGTANANDSVDGSSAAAVNDASV